MESTTQERPHSTFVTKIVEQEQEKAKTLLSTLFDNYRHPLLEAIDTLKNITPLVQSALDAVQRNYLAIQEALETYKKWMQIAQEAFERFAKLASSFRWLNFLKQIWQHVQSFAVAFLLVEYHQIHRARDGTSEKDVISLSYHYPKEFRLFCRMNELSHNKSSRIEFATHFLEALDKADKRSPLDEDNLLVSLRKFLLRLGLILRDLIRKACHELQKTFAREKSPEECIVYYQNKKYLLIPSLSALTDISESTIRRYASEGKYGAIKLPYISARSGNKNMAWHFPYSPELISNLKAHSAKNKRQRDKLFTRKQVASVLGIHVDTLRNWERKGLANTLRESGTIWYHQSQMPHLIEILKQNNSPRHQIFMAQR